MLADAEMKVAPAKIARFYIACTIQRPASAMPTLVATPCPSGPAVV